MPSPPPFAVHPFPMHLELRLCSPEKVPGRNFVNNTRPLKPNQISTLTTANYRRFVRFARGRRLRTASMTADGGGVVGVVPTGLDSAAARASSHPILPPSESRGRLGRVVSFDTSRPSWYARENKIKKQKIAKY